MTRPKPDAVVIWARRAGDACYATLVLRRPILDGMIDTREDPAAAVLDSLPPAWRNVIKSAWSCGTACFIELKPCDLETALGVGEAFEAALPESEVVMNGLYLGDVAPSARFGGYPWSSPPSAR
jgi:hypothetical protein